MKRFLLISTALFAFCPLCRAQPPAELTAILDNTLDNMRTSLGAKALGAAITGHYLLANQFSEGFVEIESPTPPSILPRYHSTRGHPKPFLKTSRKVLRIRKPGAPGNFRNTSFAMQKHILGAVEPMVAHKLGE